ncbi:LANO_0E09978g1_1 [Lachancea nothofagi CBS 11611]|uniref:GID complex catalytic subunit 2 n=1 Tax=Lachancea nothofagi CBS 11611 TaxID=1266666 RepID=A0A1G4JW71_9SACH|nr:LANO_0E09978g1_1 [Lachancea nothofagi CBS 11611]
MSELLGNLECEYQKLTDGAAAGQTHLKKCLDDTHNFKMNIKKLKGYLAKQAQDAAGEDSQNPAKFMKRRQLAVEKLNKLHKQWDSGARKSSKLAIQQYSKFQKNAINKIYDFELDQVYTNQFPPSARKHVESAIGLHISRYNLCEIPEQDSEGMVRYLENVYGVNSKISTNFVEMAQMVRQLRQDNLDSCMAWCSEGSNLEFELHLLKAMFLLQSGDKSATYLYLLKSIPDFMTKTKKSFLRHRVAPLLAQLVISSETGLKLEEQRNKCIELFTREYCARNSLPFDSSLFLVVMSGIMSFQFFIKYRTLQAARHVDWTTENELPFNVKLPDFLTNFHPIFICPVLKEETTKENPPYALPCHHIISKFSLDKLSKNGTCNFKCPYCPVTAARSKTSKVNFVIL